MDGSTEGVIIEPTDGVLRVTIDRPDRKNSLDPTSLLAIIDAFEDASTDDSLRAVLIAATGDDFCSGADWVGTNAAKGERPRTGSIQRRLPLHANRLITLIYEIQLPVVCRVQGWAAGLGCQIALAADFTIAADDAKFWLPFAKRGFSPDSAATWIIPRLVGVARAKELLLLAREITGAQAAGWGMIHRAVPAADLSGAVDELVTELASGPTVALGLAKRAINAGLESTMAEAMAREAFSLELSSRAQDFKEGLVAFKEKRDPRFEGR